MLDARCWLFVVAGICGMVCMPVFAEQDDAKQSEESLQPALIKALGVARRGLTSESVERSDLLVGKYRLIGVIKSAQPDGDAVRFRIEMRLISRPVESYLTNQEQEKIKRERRAFAARDADLVDQLSREKSPQMRDRIRSSRRALQAESSGVIRLIMQAAERRKDEFEKTDVFVTARECREAIVPELLQMKTFRGLVVVRKVVLEAHKPGDKKSATTFDTVETEMVELWPSATTAPADEEDAAEASVESEK